MKRPPPVSDMSNAARARMLARVVAHLLEHPPAEGAREMRIPLRHLQALSTSLGMVIEGEGTPEPVLVLALGD